MNQFIVDFGDEAVAAGDEVVLFGPGDSGEPTAQDREGLLLDRVDESVHCLAFISTTPAGHAFRRAPISSH